MADEHDPDSESRPSKDAFLMLVQLAQETRDDVKHIRSTDMPALNERVARLEERTTVNAAAAPARWSPTSKAGAGLAALIPLAYAAVELLRATGVLPPAPAGAPATTAISAEQ